MAEYVYIQNYAKRGTLAISTTVFDQIVETVVKKMQGVKLKSADKFLFFLHQPTHCEIKNGKINVDLQIILSQECNVNEVCLKIQEEIAYALTSCTEFIPFSINVKVVGIE